MFQSKRCRIADRVKFQGKFGDTDGDRLGECVFMAVSIWTDEMQYQIKASNLVKIKKNPEW